MAIYNKSWKELRKESYQYHDIDKRLYEILCKIDDYVGQERLMIHRMRDRTRKASQHYFGRAADGHIENMHVLDQYALLERFHPPALGLYARDVWKYTPGFHIDVRETPYGKRWAYKKQESNGSIIETSLGKDYFQHVLGLED